MVKNNIYFNFCLRNSVIIKINQTIYIEYLMQRIM